MAGNVTSLPPVDGRVSAPCCQSSRCHEIPPSVIVVQRRPGSSRVFRHFDYHLATPAIAAKAKREAIYLEQRFSDHAPLIIDYDFKL